MKLKMEKFFGKKFITKNPSETRKIGKNFAKALLFNFPKEKAVVLVLVGELGTGKTTFLQGFAKGLGLNTRIQSPTFIIMKPYSFSYKTKSQKDLTKGKFYHIDCYRIKKPQELLNLGFKDLISNPYNIIAIEWGDKIQSIIPRKSFWIYFKHRSPSQREILFKKNCGKTH